MHDIPGMIYLVTTWKPNTENRYVVSYVHLKYLPTLVTLKPNTKISHVHIYIHWNVRIS